MEHLVRHRGAEAVEGGQGGQGDRGKTGLAVPANRERLLPFGNDDRFNDIIRLNHHGCPCGCVKFP